MKALVEFLVKSLVSHPEGVMVTERPAALGQVFELAVAKDDLGRVIGRQGRTIKAIRHVVAAAAAKAKTKVSIVVAD